MSWVKIYSSVEEFKARIVEDILKQMASKPYSRKARSAIPSLGESALYTPPGKSGSCNGNPEKDPAD